MFPPSLPHSPTLSPPRLPVNPPPPALCSSPPFPHHPPPFPHFRAPYHCGTGARVRCWCRSSSRLEDEELAGPRQCPCSVTAVSAQRWCRCCVEVDPQSHRGRRIRASGSGCWEGRTVGAEGRIFGAHFPASTGTGFALRHSQTVKFAGCIRYGNCDTGQKAETARHVERLGRDGDKSWRTWPCRTAEEACEPLLLTALLGCFGGRGCPVSTERPPVSPSPPAPLPVVPDQSAELRSEGLLAIRSRVCWRQTGTWTHLGVALRQRMRFRRRACRTAARRRSWSCAFISS